MTDKELLKLAAKAAGIELVETTAGYPLWIAGHGEWNPLTDDGDALRLAVALNMTIYPGFPQVQMGYPYGPKFGDPCTDPIAATRRAIVKAAAEAEIGKEMK